MLECNNSFRSSTEQFKEFLETSLWQDMLQELDNWENRLMEELAAPTFDVTTGQMVMGKAERGLYDEMLRGSLKAVDHMRLLPTIVMEIIEQTKVETKNERKQGSADAGSNSGNDEFEFESVD